MNHITANDNSKNQMINTKATYTDATQPANMLELFAEELPEQHDMLKSSTVGTVGCGGTAFGSTVGTLSTFSTAS